MDTVASTELFCPHCGYDLRSSFGRCPECGQSFDRADMAISKIPWVHRKQLGWRRAWSRTVWLTLRSPDKLAQEIARPVSWRDASRFRWLTIFIVSLFITALLATAYPWLDRSQLRVDLQLNTTAPSGDGIGPLIFPMLALIDGPGLLAVAFVGSFLGMAAVSWWLRTWFWLLSGSFRHKASALSCYLSAWWIVAAFCWIEIAVYISVKINSQTLDGMPWPTFPLIIGLFWFTLLTATATCAIGNIRLLKKATRCGWSAAIFATFAFQVGGAIVFATTLDLATYSLGLLALAWKSLTS